MRNRSNKIRKGNVVILCMLMMLGSIFIVPSISAESNGASYVIITTNDIETNSEELDHFIYMKELNGHSVKVVTESDFLGLTGQYPNDRADKIRQWLINNYQTLGIDYVLLIGNPNPDDTKNPSDHVGDMPMKMCWPKYFRGGTGNPTDLYYGDLDSNWDLDGDGFYYELLDYNNPTSPAPSIIASDTFSVFWTGEVMCDYDVDYTFKTLSDDGVRLMIDGSFVIDNWDEHDLCFDEGTVSLSAGLHDISVFFRENYGDGIIKLYWITEVESDDPRYIKELIPYTHLYDADGNVGNLTGFYYDNNDFTGYEFTQPDPEINFEWGTGDIGNGHPDLEAEVYVGRIPVYEDDYGQLDAILRKIIDYETDPGDISWRESILLPMRSMDDATPSWGLGEGIRNDFALAAGFNCFRIYEEDYSSSGGPIPELWPCEYKNVWNEWKNGYGMVTWHTHGGTTYAKHVIRIGDLSHLDDSKPAFIFQASCHNACPEKKNNLAYSLLKRGGIAMVAGTRMTTYMGGDYITFTPTSHFNHQMAYFYTKKIIKNGMPAGMALNEVVKYHTELSPNAIRFNLYGDPDCYLLTTFPNLPPVADANGSYSGYEGSAITFDASGSYDPEGSPLEYRWDFDNDGTWNTAWSTSPYAEFTGGDDYSGTVKVEVRDQIGKTDTDTSSVTVGNVAPTIDTLATYTVYENVQVTLTARATDLGSDDLTFTWDWGDSSSDTTTYYNDGVAPDPYPSPGGTYPFSVTECQKHIYTDLGMYTVTVTVEDDDGGKTVEETTVEVVIPPAVGGEVHPVNKIGVLAPWIAVIAAMVAGAAIVWRRRRAQS